MKSIPPPSRRTFVHVHELLGPELDSIQLSVLCGESHLENKITNPRVQKPGLSFAGYYPYIKEGRVQIIGQSETSYLGTLGEEVRQERFDKITALPVPVFVITKGITPLPGFLRFCRMREVPVLSSPVLSSVIIKQIGYFLEEHLVPSTTVHGVLMEIYGLGVLLLGDSGVGKSEAALDLITRGHCLVADDRVAIKRFPNGELVGFSNESLRHHMELRGIGIINIQDLFGLASIRERKSVDLVVELAAWNPARSYDRLGLEETVYRILDKSVPFIHMPVATGRNLSNLIEIGARNHVLKLQGYNSAQVLIDKLAQRGQENTNES